MSNSPQPAIEPVEPLSTRWSRSRQALGRQHLHLFGTLTRAASDTRTATADYVAFLACEGARWRAFVTQRREALRSSVLHRAMLNGVRQALGSLQSKVDQRVAELEHPAPAAVQAPPLTDYDSLSAAKVKAALDELDGSALRAVELYERAHKNRVTVIRALEKRLAA